MAGNLIYAACQWMALIAIARLGTPEMVGEFAFALAVTSPIIIFFNLNMRAFQATDIKGEYLFIDYLFARLTQTVLALLTIFIVVTVSGYASSIVLIVAGVSLYKAIESISDIYYGRMQKREKMSRIGRSIALRGMLYLASLYAA